MNKIKIISLLSLLVISCLHCNPSEVNNPSEVKENKPFTQEEFDELLQFRKLIKPFFSQKMIDEASKGLEDYYRAMFNIRSFEKECGTFYFPNCTSILETYKFLLEWQEHCKWKLKAIDAQLNQSKDYVMFMQEIEKKQAIEQQQKHQQ